MGCFNVTCALSGLAIRYGDPCYYIPLLPSGGECNVHQQIKSIKGENFICSNEGERAFFDVGLLPILGQYNDYGGIENPKINSNTKAIERILKTDIYSFLKNPTSFKAKVKVFVYSVENPHFEDKELPLSGCFIHKFAYDKAHKYIINDNDSMSCRSCFNCFPVGNYILDQLGINPPIEDQKAGRYKFIYCIDGEDKYCIMSDEQFSHIGKKMPDGTYKELELIHSIKKMEKQWLKITGKPFPIKDETRKKLLKKHILNKDLELASSFFRAKIAALAKDVEGILKECPQWKHLDLERIFNIMDLRGLTLDETRYGKLFARYYEELANNDPLIRNLMCEVDSLSAFMFLNNKMFMPSLSGPQGGDLSSEKALIKASEKYLSKKKMI